MKKYLYLPLLLMACWLVSACHESEIDFYDQTARLNFDRSLVIVTFVDSDYVKKTPFKEEVMDARLQGDLLKEKRTFVIKAVDDTAFTSGVKVELAGSYTFADIDTVAQSYSIKVMRPEDMLFGRTAYGSSLVFDYGNPAHQFDKGVEERQRLTVNVRWNIQPEEWPEWDFGTYSDAKYKYMMDFYGCTINDIPYDDYEKVKEAYNAYLEQGNKPILDDKGEPISFEAN